MFSAVHHRLVAGALLLAPAALAFFMAADGAAAASSRVELEFEDDDVIVDTFADDGAVAVFNVDLQNEGDAPAFNFDVFIYQKAAFPASMGNVIVESGNPGITCVRLSSLKTRCHVSVLAPGEEADIRVELITGDARGLDRHGTLRIAATGLDYEENVHNNHDSFDYTVVENLDD